MAALGLEDDQDLVGAARGLLFSGRQLQMCASIPALGELVVKMCERPRSEYELAAGRLREHVSTGRLELYGLGPVSNKVVGWMDEVHAADPFVNPTDMAIVACVLVDDLSDGIYMTDPSVIESQGLGRLFRREDKRFFFL
jgi:hypothetical protein